MSHWQSVLQHVKLSIYAEQMFCSLTTQMKFDPQFSNQPSLKTLHKENYETSYHRNTAAGNLRRLAAGEQDETLVLMSVECITEAREHDSKGGRAFRSLIASDASGRNMLNSAKYWHARRKFHLRHAASLLYSMVGPEVWQQGVSLAE